MGPTFEKLFTGANVGPRAQKIGAGHKTVYEIGPRSVKMSHENCDWYDIDFWELERKRPKFIRYRYLKYPFGASKRERERDEARERERGREISRVL